MVRGRQHLGGGLAEVGLVLLHHVFVLQLGVVHVGDTMEGADECVCACVYVCLHVGAYIEITVNGPFTIMM